MNEMNQIPPQHQAPGFVPAPLRSEPELTLMSSSIFTPITEDLTAPIDEFPTKKEFYDAGLAKFNDYADTIRGTMVNMTEADVQLVMKSTKEIEIGNPNLPVATAGLTEDDTLKLAQSLRADPIPGKTARNVVIVPNVEIKLTPNLTLRERGAKTVLILMEKSLLQLKGLKQYTDGVQREFQEEADRADRHSDRGGDFEMPDA